MVNDFVDMFSLLWLRRKIKERTTFFNLEWDISFYWWHNLSIMFVFKFDYFFIKIYCTKMIRCFLYLCRNNMVLLLTIYFFINTFKIHSLSDIEISNTHLLTTLNIKNGLSKETNLFFSLKWSLLPDFPFYYQSYFCMPSLCGIHCFRFLCINENRNDVSFQVTYCT